MLGKRFCDSSKKLQEFEYLYDFALHNQMDWPCSSIKFGGRLLDSEGCWNELVYFGCRGDGVFNYEQEVWEGEPSLLAIASIKLPKYGYKLTSQSKGENFLKVAKVLKHPGEINSLAVWPKQPFFIGSVTDSNVVFLWDLRNHDDDKKLHFSMPEAPDLVLSGASDLVDFAISFFNEGPLLCAGSKDSHVYVWNFEDYMHRTGRSEGKPQVEEEDASPPSLNKINRNLSNYLNDPIRSVLDPIHKLIGHEGAVEDAKFHPNLQQLLVSVGVDGCINFWNTSDSNKPIHSIKDAHKNDINFVDWSTTNKNHIATASHDKTVKIWDTRTYTCLDTVELSSPINFVKFAPKDPGVIAFDCSHLVIRNYENKQNILLHRGHDSKITDFDWCNSDQMTICSISDESEFGDDSEIGGGAIQVLRPLDLLWLPKEEAIKKMQHSFPSST